MKKTYKGIIFDLDGVICHTDALHYKAWKQVADMIGIEFNETINNRLRGVSRMESLEMILERSSHTYTEKEKQELAERKNNIYVELLDTLAPEQADQDVKATLETLKQTGIKMAIGSSSKNTPKILHQLRLEHFFDAISDGNQIRYTKPDPEVFLLAAEKLGLSPAECLVVEDAQAGIAAGISGGFDTAAIGAAAVYEECTYKLERLSDLFEIIGRGLSF